MKGWIECEQDSQVLTQEMATTLKRDFLKQARQYEVEIMAAREALQYVQNQFPAETDLSPSDCKDAIVYLNNLKSAVHDFCRLLDKSIYLPVTIISSIYQLVIILHHMDEQVDRLSTTMRNFSLLGDPSSKKAQRKRKELSSRLASFMLSSEHSLGRVGTLLDQAYFPSAPIDDLLQPLVELD